MIFKKLIFILFLTLASSRAYAIFNNDPALQGHERNHKMLKNDSKRPVGKISRDLNITKQEFIECFENVNPAPSGTNPSRQTERMNKNILLPCLQKANPKITNDKLDDIMDKYRPEGRLRIK